MHKFYTFSGQNSGTFDISLASLRLTIVKLSALKDSLFLAHPVLHHADIEKCDEHICLWVVYKHISETTCLNFTKFSLHVACVHSLDLLWWRSNPLCSFGCMDDVLFFYNGPMVT